MRKFLPLLSLVLAGCASTPEVQGPVDHFEYGAISHDPFWLVSIGDDRIVVTTGPSGGHADGDLTTTEFPRVLPQETADGVRRWQSGDGTNVVILEARQGSCTTGGRTYTDSTRLTFGGQARAGCGGPEVRGTGA